MNKINKKLIIILTAIFLVIVAATSLIYVTTSKEPETLEVTIDYEAKAKELLDTMTTNEKIAQILLVRFNEEKAESMLEKYPFGGFVLFGVDFKGKTKEQVIQMIQNVQSKSKIPLAIAVDEEGGTVVRVSSNRNLIHSKFKSPRELYLLAGFNLFEVDALQKAYLLHNLGINLNLAPVVDISTNEDDFIYDRALGENAELTARFAKIVITASKKSEISYTLKHFPGYGNNEDTHTDKAIDNRSYDKIINEDLLPFKAGIDAGAELIMINHNIVVNIDENNPASLSKKVISILRNDLNFKGIIVTDDISMGAVSKIKDVAAKAVVAGNDLIITTDYEDSFKDIKKYLENGKISLERLDEAVIRILTWKYTRGIIK